jgi:cobalamin biosynthesis Mg chelatase CobN
MKQGWEFVYPRKQALELAKSSHEPVLTTASDTPVAQMSGNDLTRVDDSGNNVAMSASAQAAGETTQQGEVSAAASQSGSPSQSETASGRTTAMRTQLPTTASTEPLVIVFGALCLTLSLGMRLLRRKAA